MRLRFLWSLVLVLTASSRGAAPAESTSSAGIEFFETKIRPVFVERCYKCHSAGSEKLEASFRLDSPEGILAGGESGKSAIVAGHPESSPLIQAIHYTDEDLQMPPKQKLPPEQIANIEAWVKMGAPYPKAAVAAAPTTAPVRMTLQEGRKFWSFKRPEEQTVPVIARGAWSRNEIDRFVLAKLDEKHLAPSPEADRRTLIRRATYDLIGLPPTAEECDQFAADNSPGAYENLIDRLLASPHYGERWGRHWLDVARYADTRGYVFEEERRYAFSYTYRDWVVRAFNEDLPYDQFVIQQIAADRLQLGGDKRPLAALGFLTLGRRFLNAQQDIIDDRIDVVTRGTMGLTVSCARCHDHKFDPIPTADYYSLYGVFQSSAEPAILPMIGPAEKPSASAEYEKELAKLMAARDQWKEARVAALIKEAKAKDPNSKLDAAGAAAMFNVADHQKVRELQRGIDALPVTHPGAPLRAMAMEDAQPVTPRIFKRGNAGNPGDEVPRRFLAILSPDDRQPFKDGSGRLEMARAIASKDNPLTARVMVNRVWQHHFGAGLVRTPSDFGTRGERPTHPELLDWLAMRFVNEDGWSIKKLHKRIMLSATYRQASYGGASDGPSIDPENRLLWHMNPQRLDFESMRDSLLAVSGQLDLAMGGRSVDILAEPFTARRTLYAFIDRQNLPGTFRTFDFASPDMTQGQRPATSVPQQALFMMNSPFVITQAKKIVARLAVITETNAALRVAQIYRTVLGREPAADEINTAVRFIREDESLAAPSVPAAPPPSWAYGFGEYDESTGRMKSFHKLRHYTGLTWQGSAAMPDDKVGWAMLSPTGGHPGDLAHAVVRRWIAPRECDISISGTLAHPAPEGDGVRGRLISSRDGTLATWAVHTRQAETHVSPVHVKQGDTIDFVVDCGPAGNFNYDSFEWKVAITKVAAVGAVAGDDTGNTWDAVKDFSGPAPRPPIPINAWEKFAQVLLESNEFMFVD